MRMIREDRDDLSDLDASEIARLVRVGEISPVEVVDATLARIERLNPTLNAVCTVAADAARAAARSSERAVLARDVLGPLHGVPVAIKDVTPTAGMRTTFGSRLYRDHVPNVDADIVARLKRAGAIVVGKTNTSEFAAGANTFNDVFGATRNPWNTAMSAGGSTGGGAAALAARMVPLAEGTDFGGSLRIPASFCGVVGLRPTAGLVPIAPSQTPWDTLRVAGPMARTAEDIALAMEAITGPSDVSPIAVAPPESDFVQLVRRFEAAGLRLGYVPDVSGVGIDPEIEAACRAAALGLDSAGARIEETSLDLSEGRGIFPVLRGVAVLTTHLERLERIGEMGDNLAGNIRSGEALTVHQIAQAEAARARLWRGIRQFFSDYDALLTPCVPVAPFPVEQNYPDAVNGKPMETYIDWIAPTFVISLLSVPAASVPVGLTREGLPVGMQIVCPRFHDARVLGLARAVQERCPLPPPVVAP